MGEIHNILLVFVVVSAAFLVFFTIRFVIAAINEKDRDKYERYYWRCAVIFFISMLLISF